MGLTLPILVTVSLLVLFLIPGLVYASRYVKAGPNDVLIVSGRAHRIFDPRTGKFATVGFRIVKGGGTYVWPVLEKCDRLSLELMTMDVRVPDLKTANGIPANLEAVAQVKIGADDASLRIAAEQHLSRTPAEIKNIALLTVEGCLRELMAARTIEEIHKDRMRVADDLQGASAGDLAAMGLQMISFTIKEVSDTQGYLDALAQPRIAEVKREAIIAEATANRDAQIRAAEVAKAASRARFEAEALVAEQQAQYEMKRAEYAAMVEKKRRELGLGRRCACGAENVPDSKFCNQCGKTL